MSGRDPVAVLGVAVLVLAVAGIALASLAGVFAAPTAVRTGFAVAAAVIGLAVYLPSRRAAPVPPESDAIAADRTAKLLLSGGGLAVAVTAWTGTRLFGLLVFLPAGYVLVADGIRRGGQPGPTLLAVATLFAVPVFTKYLTTGFYFGGTDTFAHVDAVNRLLETNTAASLPHGYDYFPGFHFVVGAVSLFGDLRPYDAIVFTGILVLTLLVPVSYLLGSRLFEDRRLGLGAAVGITVLEYVAYHALYFFPQALALVTLTIVGYAVVSVPEAATSDRFRRYVAYAVGMVFVLVAIHHLTYVLFFVPLAILAVVSALVWAGAPRLSTPALGGVTSPGLRFRWVFPVVFGAAVLLAYLVYSPTLILFGIAGFSYVIFSGLVGAGEGPATFLYGVTPLVDSLPRGFQWLRTPTGLYYSALGGILLAGLYDCLSSVNRYARHAGLLVVAFASVPLFFPLPVEVPQLERLLFVLTVFAIFPLAIGLTRTLRASRQHRGYAVLALLLVATLGTTGALSQLTADDIDRLHLDERDTQSEMSEREYAAVVNTAAFLDEFGTETAASDYVTRRSVESAISPSPMSDGLRAEADGLSGPAGYLVVRESWGDHTVPVSSGENLLTTQERWFSVSPSRLEAALAGRTVVHSTGETHVVYEHEGYEGVLGEGGAS
jgi:hypothetical protein